jgi:hypothetical protein
MRPTPLAGISLLRPSPGWADIGRGGPLRRHRRQLGLSAKDAAGPIVLYTVLYGSDEDAGLPD